MKLILLLSNSIYAIDIIGTWKLTNKTTPFTCCALVSYEIVLVFNQDNTIELAKKQKTMFSTTRHYQLKNDELTMYLKNENSSIIQNFFMRNSSTNQTFQLKQSNNACYKAAQVGRTSNSFEMCKI